MAVDEKIALVTGSSGIGLATAVHLAKRGIWVHLGGIDEERNRVATTKAGSLPVTLHKVDVADEIQVKNWVDGIVAQAGGVDILVNAAGIQAYGTIETTNRSDWDRVMEVNLRSCFLTSRAVYPSMKQRGGGAIVHVSSVQGHSNQNNVLAYATAKGAVHALTRAMAVDCAKDQIRVNSISPGSIRTPLLEYSAQQLAAGSQTVEDMLAEFGKAHPVGRVGTADEVAALIGFLVSAEGKFCTGADFRIDGGLTAQLGV